MFELCDAVADTLSPLAGAGKTMLLSVLPYLRFICSSTDKDLVLILWSISYKISIPLAQIHVLHIFTAISGILKFKIQ
jgi:hypothetical protein